MSRPPRSGPASAAGGPAPARLDADAIAAAAAGCPAVSRLTAGPFGASTYLPGRQVAGVEITDEEVRVHVVGWYGRSVAEIGAQVRDAVSAVAPGAPVDVVIEDLDVGDDPAGRSAT